MAYTWQQLKLGGGGIVGNIDIANDGTRVARTDTGGAFVRPAGQTVWQQLLTDTRMPASDAGFGNFGGIYDICVAPSNSQNMWMLNPKGWLLRSTNGGATWTRTNLAQQVAIPNNGLPNDQSSPASRMMGGRMKVDPGNASICYVGTPDNGLYFTTDGVNFTRVTSVPNAASHFSHLVAFDLSSSASGGVWQGIYVTSYGNGIYRSTNGGQNNTWTAVSGAPTTHQYMFCDHTGTLWHIDCGPAGNAGTLRRYKAGVWTNMSALMSGGVPANISAVFVDPNDVGGNKIYAFATGMWVSLNGGNTWSAYQDFAIASGSQIPWQYTCEMPPSPAHIIYPINGMWDKAANVMVFGTGVGTYTVNNNPPNTGAVTYTPDSTGLENMDATCAISVPNGGPLALTIQDRPFWRITNPAAYPSTYGPDFNNEICWGHEVCFANSNPNVLYANHHTLVGGNSGGAYRSLDAGQTWTKLNNPSGFQTTYYGTSMCAFDANKAVWAFSNNGPMNFTANGGSSWSACSGVPASGWGGQYWNNTNRLASDGLDANTGYAYNDGTGFIYKTLDGGATWARCSDSSFTPNATQGFYFGQLKSVWGKSGHLFYTDGVDENGILPNGRPFFRSLDHGVSWTQLTNVQSVFRFGIGAPVPGQGSGYPAVYIAGYVSGTIGIYRSDNADQASPTWTLISAAIHPIQNDVMSCMTGDYNVPSRVVIGYLGSAFIYGEDPAIVGGGGAGTSMAAAFRGFSLAGQAAALSKAAGFVMKMRYKKA